MSTTEAEVREAVERTLATACARSLTREELADITGFAPNTVRVWVAERILPPEYVMGEQGRGGQYRIAPQAVALLLIGRAIGDAFGPNNPLMKPICRQIASRVSEAWRNPKARAVLTVEIADMTITLDVTAAVREARHRLAAMPA